MSLKLLIERVKRRPIADILQELADEGHYPATMAPILQRTTRIKGSPNRESVRRWCHQEGVNWERKR